MNEETYYREDKAAGCLGLSKTVIRDLRERLIEGTHWVRKKNSVAYTQAGLDALVQQVNAASPVDVPATILSEEAEGVAEEATTRITRIWPARPSWVEVEFNPEQRLPIRIRRGVALRVGMYINVRKNELGWHMFGRPLRAPQSHA